MQWQQELEAAEDLARGAGEILLRFYRGTYAVDMKAGQEPVTEADRAANEYIVTRLAAAFPADTVVAEESEFTGTGQPALRTWMVDPMDGTREFIDNTDEFSVMIGLAVDGRPVLGVINQPAADTLYRGVVGAGAERVHGDSVAELSVSDISDTHRMRLVVSRSHLPESVARMARHLGIRELQRSGSVGLKIGRIASAACDLYLHPVGGTKLWDSCAPEAVLHAAGGCLTDFDGHTLEYDPRQVINRRGLLASNGHIQAELVRSLAGLF